MAQLLICVRHQDTIFHYGVYSRNLAPVQFDESAAGVALRHDPCTGAGQYFLIRSVTVILPREKVGSHLLEKNDIEISNRHLDNKTCHCSIDYCGHQQNQGISVQKISFVHLQIEYRVCVDLPANLAYCCFQEVERSKHFRHGFVKFFHKKYKWKDCRDISCVCEDVYEVCDYGITVPKLIEVSVQFTPVDICHAWYNRLEGLARKRVILEETMVWLSTLGGGYSSLGDYFAHFSEKAGKISVTQLRIAIEMGDPIMASKCRLFYALSLMQRGPLRYSKWMIRNEYAFATSYKYMDQRLIDMCKGMWSKLQYFYYRRNRMKLSTTTSKQITTSRQKLSTTSSSNGYFP